MKLFKTVSCSGIVFVLFILIISGKDIYAIPSFARQTNLACNSCHTIFPELNSFGRAFKLGGYTLTMTESVKATDNNDNTTLNLLKSLPLSAMIQASYNYTNKKQPGTLNNTVSFPQQFSLFLGGEFTPKIGGFIQVTYDDQGGAIGIDNTDLRYADQTDLASESFAYGITLNNNPTVQDLWNSTPAWGYPYASSSVAPVPMAATLIEGGLAQNVLGLGAYGLWNDLIYGEVSIYRSAQQGAPSPPDSTSFGIIKNVSPYWRVAIQKQYGSNYIELGTFGIASDMYPAGITGMTDNYTDIGFDVNYEKSFDDNELTVHGTWINESRKLNASFNAGNVMNSKSKLNSFKLVGNYYLNHQYGFSLGYFSLMGDSEPGIYTPGIFFGSANGKPDSNGLIAEVDYLPWLNTKFSVQYIAYNKFNGQGSNYDGNGRNASDNNTVYVAGWFAF
jgi:hypothetical protein